MLNSSLKILVSSLLTLLLASLGLLLVSKWKKTSFEDLQNWNSRDGRESMSLHYSANPNYEKENSNSFDILIYFTLRPLLHINFTMIYIPPSILIFFRACKLATNTVMLYLWIFSVLLLHVQLLINYKGDHPKYDVFYFWLENSAVWFHSDEINIYILC